MSNSVTRQMQIEECTERLDGLVFLMSARMNSIDQVHFLAETNSFSMNREEILHRFTNQYPEHPLIELYHHYEDLLSSLKSIKNDDLKKM
ncbi:MAG: hypothetical protein QM703_27120 [Gemmatales bacterium]